MSFISKILIKNDNHLLEEFYLKYSSQTNLNINLKLEQSPNILDAFSVLGSNIDVLAVIDTNKNHIACACVLSQKDCYINGSLYKIGYVSGLKARQEYRGTLAFARFLILFKEYSKNNAVCWLFSVFSDNILVNELVKNKRQLLPIIDKINIYNSYIFKSKHLYFKTFEKTNIKIKFATIEDKSNIEAFLLKNKKTHDLTPYYTVDNIFKGTGLLKDFSYQNLALAVKNNKIVGMLALWDQTKFRRWWVESYSKKYQFIRPLLNIGSKIMFMPNLPMAGNIIDYKIVCLNFIENNDIEIYKLLFNTLVQKSNQKNSLFSVGFTQNQNYNSLFKKRCVKLENNIYLGYWQQHTELIKSIRNNNIYIEQGGL